MFLRLILATLATTIKTSHLIMPTRWNWVVPWMMETLRQRKTLRKRKKMKWRGKRAKHGAMKAAKWAEARVCPQHPATTDRTAACHREEGLDMERKQQHSAWALCSHNC
jgi:hypothetical protein